ncbi:hypothetical protein [Rhodopirellula europaea]|nr:hypothetical protein [Rhodopirellula europaea]
MNQSNNFIQSHARNRRYVSTTVAQMQAVDSIESVSDLPRTIDTAAQESSTGLERSERVTRRLDEAVLRLDRAASLRRQQETEGTGVGTPTDHVAPASEPFVPAPKAPLIQKSSTPINRPSDRLKPMVGDRRDDVTGMQLDASVAESSSIWMETADQSARLRIDRPVNAEETARRIGEPLIVSGVAKVPVAPVSDTNTIETVVSQPVADSPAPSQIPAREPKPQSMPEVAVRVAETMSEAERYLAESMWQQTAAVAEPAPSVQPETVKTT